MENGNYCVAANNKNNKVFSFFKLNKLKAKYVLANKHIFMAVSIKVFLQVVLFIKEGR